MCPRDGVTCALADHGSSESATNPMKRPNLGLSKDRNRDWHLSPDFHFTNEHNLARQSRNQRVGRLRCDVLLTSKSLFSEEENGACPRLILSYAARDGLERSDAVERERRKKTSRKAGRAGKQETATDDGSKRIFS